MGVREMIVESYSRYAQPNGAHALTKSANGRFVPTIPAEVDIEAAEFVIEESKFAQQANEFKDEFQKRIDGHRKLDNVEGVDFSPESGVVMSKDKSKGCSSIEVTSFEPDSGEVLKYSSKSDCAQNKQETWDFHVTADGTKEYKKATESRGYEETGWSEIVLTETATGAIFQSRGAYEVK